MVYSNLQSIIQKVLVIKDRHLVNGKQNTTMARNQDCWQKTVIEIEAKQDAFKPLETALAKKSNNIL